MLAMVSATIQSLSGEVKKRISNDFIAACIYTLVAMGDAQLRMCSDCDLKNDFQAQAALHVTWVAFMCHLIIIPLIQLVCQRNTKWVGDILKGPWRLQEWVAFMFVIIVQVSSTFPSSRGFISMVFTHMCIAMMVVFLIVPPSAIAEPGPGVVLYICCYVFYGKHLPMERISLPIYAPHTGSSIKDMDQTISLGTAILFLVLQWKPWHLIPQFIRWLRRRDTEQPSRSLSNHPIYEKLYRVWFYRNDEENSQLEQGELDV
jgi:hypothetical protein